MTRLPGLPEAAVKTRAHKPLAPVYRRLRKSERGELLAHLLRLDENSRFFRFGYPAAENTLRHYCSLDGPDEPVIIGAFIGGILRGVGEIRPYGNSPNGEAEIAFSVEKEWQSLGIGRTLMAEVMVEARLNKIPLLQLNCLPENYRMRRLAEHFGAHFVRQTGLIRCYFEPLGPKGELATAGSAAWQ